MCCWWKRQGRGSIMPLARTPGIPPAGWAKKKPVREFPWGTEPLCPPAPRQLALKAAGLSAATPPAVPPHLWGLLVVLPLRLQQRLDQRLLHSLLGHLLWLGEKRGGQSHTNSPLRVTHAPSLLLPDPGGPSRDQPRTRDAGSSGWGHQGSGIKTGWCGMGQGMGGWQGTLRSQHCT